MCDTTEFRVYTMVFFSKERGAIKNYDNVQLLVEKFTFHNLNAPHKQTSQNEKRNCLCDTSLCGTQPHTYEMLCMCHVPIGPFTHGPRSCDHGNARVLKNHPKVVLGDIEIHFIIDGPSSLR